MVEGPAALSAGEGDLLAPRRVEGRAARSADGGGTGWCFRAVRARARWRCRVPGPRSGGGGGERRTGGPARRAVSPGEEAPGPPPPAASAAAPRQLPTEIQRTKTAKPGPRRPSNERN